MKSYSLVFFITFVALSRGVAASAQPPHFRALAFYSTAEEPDHVQFAEGAWMGFHAAGYNDKDTGWPWFVDFLGGAGKSIEGDSSPAQNPGSHRRKHVIYRVHAPAPRGA